MDIHPWSKYEIAHSRHEERVLRGIAAYKALRAHEVGTETPDVGTTEATPTRLLDRLLHRVPPSSARASAEPTP